MGTLGIHFDDILIKYDATPDHNMIKVLKMKNWIYPLVEKEQGDKPCSFLVLFL